jgi:hypothetical protein
MVQRTQRSRVARRLSALLAIVVLGAAMLIPAVSASAAEPTDMVLEWNLNAVNAIGNLPTATPPGLGQAPPPSVISLAMVQGAVYDAVNAIDGTHEPYLLHIHAPADASQAAAVATAAHNVLVGLVAAPPPQVIASLDALYATSLGKIPDGQAKTDGITVGTAAAAVMLADRVGDGRTGTGLWPVGTEPGQWRLVPPTNLNVFSWVGDIRPFSLMRTNQFKADAPPKLTSKQYAAEFNEVKALGAKTGSSRTAEQTALANWIVVNPFPQQNAIFRDLSTSHGLSTAEQARLFALTTVSSADALIDCFNQKGFYLFWRPQTAIQNADSDGNPATVADPNWVSLFPNPGYPDMPSGYNCYTAANMNAGRAFFGTDNVAFNVTNSAGTRSYTQFSGYIHDAIEGRILIGFHFRSADVNGARIGQQTAKWVVLHDFRAGH